MIRLKEGLYALFLGFFLVSAQGYEPTLFVTGQGGLLEESESVKTSISVQDQNNSYFVVPVLVADSTVGYIALEKAKEAFLRNEAAGQRLMESADFIRGYTQFKNQLRANPSVSWFIGEGRRTQNIAGLVAQESFDLDILGQQVPTEEALQSIASMKQELGVLSEKLGDLGEKMSQAASREASFLSEPATRQQGVLVLELESVFSGLVEIDDLALQYNADVKKLKGFISLSDMEPESKKSLLGLADLSPDFQVVGNWATYVEDLRQGVGQAQKKAQLNAPPMAKAFTLRLQRREAFQALNGDQEELLALGTQYTSVSDSAQLILNERNKGQWKEKEEVKALENNYLKARQFFESREYENAKTFAAQAQENILKIVPGGFAETITPPANYTPFHYAIVALALVLLGIWLYRRKKRKDAEIGV